MRRAWNVVSVLAPMLLLAVVSVTGNGPAPVHPLSVVAHPGGTALPRLGTTHGTTPRARTSTDPAEGLRPANGDSGGVNPYEFRVSEPAPMGIADYGVSSANGPWYRYATPRELGTIGIRSLTAYNASDRLHFAGFQLNANVVITNGSASDAYWFQDVAQINTSTNNIEFIDNVWNESSGSMTVGLPAGSVRGNGTYETFHGYSIYADLPTTGYRGNLVDLAYPVNLSFEMIATEYEGVPHVDLRYLDGDGWQTYDNVSIPWAVDWHLDGFVVDGSQMTPLGTFYDTELVASGPGGGESVVAETANLSFGLQYWNGHNLQAPPDAYDFGSDTGETISNVSESVGFNGSGFPFGAATTGAGGPSFLYGQSSTAELNISTNLSAGTVLIDSDPVAFVGGSANVTVGPGRYVLTLENGSRPVASENVTVSAGEYDALALGGYHPVPVWFNETGLPVGTDWSVTLGRSPHRSQGSSIEFLLDRGTVNFSVATVPGFSVRTTHGTLDLTGPTTVLLNWTEVEYGIVVTAVGLPTGVEWNASLGGASNSTYGLTLTLRLPNGTYPLALGTSAPYVSNSTGEDVTVDGGNQSLTVYFEVEVGVVEGSVVPSAATVLLNDIPVPDPNGEFEVTVLPGSYLVQASAPGYGSYSSEVVVRPGAIIDLNITLNSSAPGISPPAPTAAPGISVVELTVIGAAAIAVVIGGAIVAVRRGR